MTSQKGMMCIAVLGLLAFVCHAAMGSDADDDRTTTHAVTVNTNGDDAAALPDFDGDGTVGFSDFVIFAGVFGSRQGDEKYQARYDLNGDGEIGFSDFVVFAQSFGKEAPSPVVAIPDANLRAAIEAALGKGTGAPITQAEMATLDSLDANDADISDLTGLESATKLRWLDLSRNRITEVSALRGLINLQFLDFGNNTSDVKTGGRLPRVVEIGNRITDVSALGALTNLRVLKLIGNRITDVSALGALTNLYYLELDRNTITDVSALGALTNLWVLDLTGNRITDVSALGTLTNLRSLDLGHNTITDVSALGALTRLDDLSLWANAITDISALGTLTNLIYLDLDRNSITNVSALGALTNLVHLSLWANAITDISALGTLTRLENLLLFSNAITDVSALGALTNLVHLELQNNAITDVSALGALTSLGYLSLAFNDISNVMALRTLTNLRYLELRGNSLDDSSVNDHIPVLKSNGTTVRFDRFRVRGDFDIEIVFSDAVSEDEKKVLQYVARRWMAVISEDLPDYEFTKGWSGKCGDQSYAIPSGERIDDLRIYMTTFEGDGAAVGWGGPMLLRDGTHLPVLGCMGFDLERANLLILGLHEVGHVLGFGSVWEELGFLQNPPNGDTHFNGPLAIAAFDDAGGRDYPGAKVPVSSDKAHWRGPMFRGEVMVGGGGGALSAITVQSLADLGYGVDVSQADPYTLSGTAGKAVAKIAVATPAIPGVDVTQADALPGADPHWQGRAPEVLPSIFGEDHWRGRLESAEQVWGRGMNFNLADDRQFWGVAPSVAEPKLKCSAGHTQGPIYVVDPQGRIVRTIGD